MRSSSVFLMNASALAIVFGASPAFGQTTQPTQTTPATGAGATQGPPEVVVPASVEEEAEQGDPDAGPRDADGSRAEGGTITVTGSRIRLPNLESFEPTTTLDRRQIDERNFTNAADALNELPGFRGSVTPAGAQGTFGQGVNFVNNYGLGSNRTLTLINGRRFVTSNSISAFNNAAFGTQTDLNIVPTILLERIDTVSTGGAPIYGSDAISGTVNVILRTQYDGIEVTALSGITEEGDNFRWNVSALGGWNFGERANLTLSIAHDRVKGVVYNERDYLRESVNNMQNPSAAVIATLRPPATRNTNDGRLNPLIGFNETSSDNIPSLVLARGINIPYLTRGGLITATNLACTAANSATNPSSCFQLASPNALQFDPNGNLVPFNQGILTTGTSNPGGQGFRFEDFTQITSDLNRTIFNAFLTVEVTSGVEVFMEGTYFRSRADELVQQPTFNSSLFGGTSGPLTFQVSNPVLGANPFLTPQAIATLTARGVNQIQVSRASADIADLTGFNETEIFRGVVGVRGDFRLFGNDWNYEASANWGQAVLEDTREDLNAQNFVNAVNVTRNAQGQIVCTTAVTRAGGNGFASGGLVPIADPNCVPFNPLGEGQASQAALNYVLDTSTAVSRQEQVVYSANVGGTLFDIWGGAIGINVGYEHREEDAEFTPSQFQQQGLGRSVAFAPLAGGYNLDEVFGELLLPLISPETGLSFVESLQLFARGRYVHNTVNGGFYSYAFGGHFAPIRDVEFRGNFTRSFRSPAITELFLPQTPGFTFVNDLCSSSAKAAGPVPAIRTKNCNAFLAAFPNATPLDAATASVPSLTGGNPTLDNERANSWTAGVIIRPSFLPRFSMTADYVSISLQDPIANLTVAQIVNACFDNEDFNLSDPANGNEFCSRIGRHPAGTKDVNGRDIGGQVIADQANPAVTSGIVNGVEILFRGWQGTLNYNIPIDRWGMNGTFSIGADMLYVKSRLVNISGVAPARTDGTITPGVISDPEFSGQLRLRYVEDTWGINTTINYTGEQLFSRFSRTPDTRELDELDDYVLVNGGIWFDPARDFRLTLSVTNVFNRVGQEYFGAIHPSSLVDLLGRRFAASVRLRF